MLFKREHSAFKKFLCGIVGLIDISQRETHDLLRSNWGKTMKQVIGISPILTKGEIFHKLHDTLQELLAKIGLTFNENERTAKNRLPENQPHLSSTILWRPPVNAAFSLVGRHAVNQHLI